MMTGTGRGQKSDRKSTGSRWGNDRKRRGSGQEEYIKVTGRGQEEDRNREDVNRKKTQRGQ